MKIYHCEQGSDAWRQCRKGIPSASNFDRVLTPGGARSAQIGDYINELIAENYVPDWEDFTGNKYTDRGTELEPLAREAFIARTGLIVEQVGFCTNDSGTAGCSPDGLIVGPDGDYIAGLEIKCPSPKVHVGYLLAGVLPPKYKAQVHGALAITGLPAWNFLSWYPGLQPLHVIVRPDSYTRAMAEALREFSRLYTEAWLLAEPKLTLKQ